MGVCYTLILIDEFDWGYVNTNKEKRLKEFQEEFGGCCDLIGQWYSTAVFDIDKQYPLMTDKMKIIEKYSDAAYYQDDLNLTGIKPLV